MNRKILVSGLVILCLVGCSDDDVGADAEVDMSITDGQVSDTSVLDAVQVDGSDDANLPDGEVDAMTVPDGDAEVADMNLPDAPLVCNSGLMTEAILGSVSGEVCCAASCGECGGGGCETRPGGADACCSINILFSGNSCRDNDAPCVLLEDSPADPCEAAGGLRNGRICCAAGCGTCGGTGCDTRPGGAASCCGGDIMTAGNVCGTPPCFFE